MIEDYNEPMHGVEDDSYDLLAFQSLMMFIAWWNEIVEKGENISHLVPPPAIYVPRTKVGKELFRHLMIPANEWVKQIQSVDEHYGREEIAKDQKVAKSYVDGQIEKIKTENSMKMMMKQIDQAIETINLPDEE